ncbi:MAG: hypothetical protein Q9203_003968 [Teloschistes exilis]
MDHTVWMWRSLHTLHTRVAYRDDDIHLSRTHSQRPRVVAEAKYPQDDHASHAMLRPTEHDLNGLEYSSHPKKTRFRPLRNMDRPKVDPEESQRSVRKESRKSSDGHVTSKIEKGTGSEMAGVVERKGALYNKEAEHVKQTLQRMMPDH